jgi:hypothetical protein
MHNSKVFNLVSDGFRIIELIIGDRLPKIDHSARHIVKKKINQPSQSCIFAVELGQSCGLIPYGQIIRCQFLNHWSSIGWMPCLSNWPSSMTEQHGS